MSQNYGNQGGTPIQHTITTPGTGTEAHVVHRVEENQVNYVGGHETPVLLRDRVRWGPIIAGLLTAIATLLVLTVLGLAIGMSAFEPANADGETVGTSAAIWGAVSALVAFFLGGWVAAKSAAVSGEGSGALNGFLVGAAALALILWLIGAGLGNVLGSVGNNIGEIANLGQEANVTVPDGQDAANVARENYDEARNSSWGTLAGLVLALGAATLGGWIGHNDRSEVVQTVGRQAAGRTRSRA